MLTFPGGIAVSFTGEENRQRLTFFFFFNFFFSFLLTKPQMRDGDSPVSSSTDVSFVIGYEGRMRMLQLTETYEFAEIFGGDHFPGKRKKAGKIERKVYR